MLHELRPFAWESPAEREPEWTFMGAYDWQAKRAPTEPDRPLPYPAKG